MDPATPFCPECGGYVLDRGPCTDCGWRAPIRVYVGCAANGEDAESQAVLEWSLRKHASAPVEIVWMQLSRDPASPFYCDPGKALGWRTEQWATPFSGFRWAVPALAGFKGRAIYMDSDVILTADIAELWGQEFAPGKLVMAKGKTASWRYCVSLWDCARAPHWIPALAKLQRDPDSHRNCIRVFRTNPNIVQAFAGQWNCLDGEDFADLGDPEIKLIHYSAMRTQPQLERAVARLALEGRRHWFDGEPARHWREDLIALFEALLEEASAEGYAVERYTAGPLFGPYKKRAVGGVGAPTWARGQARAVRHAGRV